MYIHTFQPKPGSLRLRNTKTQTEDEDLAASLLSSMESFVNALLDEAFPTDQDVDVAQLYNLHVVKTLFLP